MTAGPLDRWTAGPLDRWTAGPLDRWTAGPLDRWTAANELRRTVMRNGRLKFIVAAIAIVGCVSAAPNVRPPLAANLSTGALTGAPVPLRFDPNARVIRSTAGNLPPASYSTAQAARGESVYGNTCGACHQPGSLVGQAFVENWNDRRAYDFYALVRSTMPLDNPGGLKDQEYLDVMAYLLKANHAPGGSDSLAVDTVALRAHKIAVTFP